MAESTLLIWLFAVPAIAALAEYGLGKMSPSKAGWIAIFGATATFGIAIAIAYRLLHGVRLIALGHQLRADALSGFVALIIAFVGLATTIFAYPFLHRQAAEGKIAVERLSVYFVWSMVFLSTMTAATVNNNLIMMYVLVEATTLASALLVSFYWKPESLEAGYKYLLLCSVGITIGLLGCVIVYAAAVPLVGGANAMLISEIAKVAPQFPPMVALLAGVLIIIGFGSKAGLVPFHAWLPDAYTQSPCPVAALLSGVASKVAIYAVARIVTIFYPGHSSLGLFAVILGVITMLLGIVVAYNQTDLKRLMAYSSISQIGYIIFGFGISSYIGFYGAIYHLLNHAVNKSMLFLFCGTLLYSFGTTDMRELGKQKHSRLMAVCFFIGALSIGGMPPLNGFWSKFALYVAAGQAHLWWPFGIALGTSLLTLAVLIRAGAMIFLQSGHSESVHAHEVAVQPALAAAAAGSGTTVYARTNITPGITLSSRSKAEAAESGDSREGRRCPAIMTAVIAIMTLFIIATGLNFGFMNHLIDMSVRALMQQMAGG
jgi:hydrogenase-4 component F